MIYSKPFAVLLFLSLVHESLSSVAPFRPPPTTPETLFKPPRVFQMGSGSTKPYSNALYSRVERATFEKALYSIKQQLHGSPPPAPLAQIKGSSVLKQYFYDMGYMNYSSSLFTDEWGNETTSAINTYQNFFNLEVNGKLDNETLTHISLPRCAVPDLNFTYELTPTNCYMSWPKGKWFPNDTKVLTYGFLPDNQISPNTTKVFRDAFGRWSEAMTEMNLTTAALKFEEATYNTSDIKIEFYLMEEVGVASTMILLQGNEVFGEMVLDGPKWEEGEYELETVVMHQIGHLMGLSHSSNEESVVYPSILHSHQKKVQLSDDDKNNIQQLYNSRANSTNSKYGGYGPRFYNDTKSGGYGPRFKLYASPILLLTTLSLGFLLSIAC